ncbi:hypothetical protein A4A49_22595 [Nicotiana attenuata]|uniref:Uncharacterized protein n=1 Tax=Nicotiana attenuata TaxID=49451 RepID=A0A1J6INZ8_NICAT|nr:hypothetical protein A4A49_22595 [Nicotiana attenuata]
MIMTSADPNNVFEHYTDVADGDINRWNGHGNGVPAADAVHGVEVDEGILHNGEVEEEDALSDIAALSRLTNSICSCILTVVEYKVATLHYIDIHGQVKVGYIDVTPFVNSVQLLHGAEFDDDILHDVEVEEEDFLNDIAVGMHEDVTNLEEFAETGVDPMGMKYAPTEINGNGAAQGAVIDGVDGPWFR